MNTPSPSLYKVPIVAGLVLGIFLGMSGYMGPVSRFGWSMGEKLFYYFSDQGGGKTSDETAGKSSDKER